MRASMQTADMEISGLDSGQASRGVCSALQCIHGVAEVRIGPNERCVIITYDALRVSTRQFETAVRVMGCEVERLVVRPAQAPEVNEVPDAGAFPRPVDRPGSRQA
jgi:hypothetical protein